MVHLVVLDQLYQSVYLDWKNRHRIDVDCRKIGLILWFTIVTKDIWSKVTHKTLCEILIYLTLFSFSFRLKSNGFRRKSWFSRDESIRSAIQSTRKIPLISPLVYKIIKWFLHHSIQQIFLHSEMQKKNNILIKNSLEEKGNYRHIFWVSNIFLRRNYHSIFWYFDTFLANVCVSTVFFSYFIFLLHILLASLYLSFSIGIISCIRYKVSHA